MPARVAAASRPVATFCDDPIVEWGAQRKRRESSANPAGGRRKSKALCLPGEQEAGDPGLLANSNICRRSRRQAVDLDDSDPLGIGLDSCHTAVLLGAHLHIEATVSQLTYEEAENTGLTVEQLCNLAEAFCEADRDLSGSLGLDELRYCWRQIFPTATRIAIDACPKQLFTDLGYGDKERISFAQLVTALTTKVDTGLKELMKHLHENTHTEEMDEEPPWFQYWVDIINLQVTDTSNTTQFALSIAFNVVTQAAIIVSIVGFMVESWPSLLDASRCTNSSACTVDEVTAGNAATSAVELVSVCIFAAEVGLRAWAAPNKVDFWCSGLTWIDIVSIIPFLIALFLDDLAAMKGLVVIRSLRLVRIARVLRVLKITRHSQGILLMVTALRRSAAALSWLLMTLCIATVLFGSLEFFVEREGALFNMETRRWMRPNNSRYNDAGRDLDLQSVPDALWWSLVTLTTVGFGDQKSVTELGKLVSSLTQLVGLLLLAYPVTLLGSTFQQAIQEFRQQENDGKRRRALRLRLRQQYARKSWTITKSPLAPDFGAMGRDRSHSADGSSSQSEGRSQGDGAAPLIPDAVGTFTTPQGAFGEDPLAGSTFCSAAPYGRSCTDQLSDNMRGIDQLTDKVTQLTHRLSTIAPTTPCK